MAYAFKYEPDEEQRRDIWAFISHIKLATLASWNGQRTPETPFLLGFSDSRKCVVWYLAGRLPAESVRPKPPGYHRMAANYLVPSRRFITLYGWAEQVNDPLRVAWLRRHFAGFLFPCATTTPILLKMHAEKAVYADTYRDGMSYLWERARAESLKRPSDWGAQEEVLL